MNMDLQLWNLFEFNVTLHMKIFYQNFHNLLWIIKTLKFGFSRLMDNLMVEV